MYPTAGSKGRNYRAVLLVKLQQVPTGGEWAGGKLLHISVVHFLYVLLRFTVIVSSEEVLKYMEL